MFTGCGWCESAVRDAFRQEFMVAGNQELPHGADPLTRHMYIAPAICGMGSEQARCVFIKTCSWERCDALRKPCQHRVWRRTPVKCVGARRYTRARRRAAM